MLCDGTVTDFDGGIVIGVGTRNMVKDMTARDNIGRSVFSDDDTQYGDGMAILSSTDNRS